MSSQQFKYSTSTILYPTLMVFAIWLVFWYQVNIDYGIKSFGIRPHKIEGLLGVFFSPFLHSNIDHLYNNSIPLFILSLSLFYFYKEIAWKVIFYGILLSGLLTWVIGSSGNHIGASGLIYVLFSFVFFKGIFAKHYRLIALSLVIIFIYGSMIWYIFPVKQGMSWEGHLGGLLSGLFFALIFREKIAQPERFKWEQPDYKEEEDPFMRHFDEDGNFIENLEQDQNENDESTSMPQVKYIFKAKDALKDLDDTN